MDPHRRRHRSRGVSGHVDQHADLRRPIRARYRLLRDLDLGDIRLEQQFLLERRGARGAQADQRFGAEPRGRIRVQGWQKLGIDEVSGTGHVKV